MNLKLRICGYYCVTDEFEINGVRADLDDFGEQYDAAEEQAEDYCCEDMTFFPKLPTSEVLEKYKITVDEYREICERLREGLSFGCCGWCS